MDKDKHELKPFEAEGVHQFFTSYRSRYSQTWEMSMGLIPELPTSFDNANDTYALMRWLQSGFKQLMDDFLNLEMEFEDFKNALIELLIKLIPDIIREFIHSEEFRQYIFNLIDEWYKNNLEQTINNILNDIKDIKQEISNIKNDITNLQVDNKYLKNIIKNLQDSGAMDKDGNMLSNIAHGNISLFAESIGSNYFIRTRKGTGERDISAK